MKLNRIAALLMLSTLPLMAQSASYTVVELPSNDLSLNQFGSAIDETGMVLTTLNTPFNSPIDLSLIDLSNLLLTDPDAAAAGNFNDFDYSTIAQFIFAQTSANSLTSQKLTLQVVYKTDGTDISYVSGFDQETDNTDGFTFAQQTAVGDSVNGTHIVGSMAGPFKELPYVNEEGQTINYVINDFRSRAFVQVGDNVTELVPNDSIAGGFSAAEAINKNLQIAGSSSDSAGATLANLLENCADDELRGDRPIEVCYYSLRLTTFAGLFNQRAVVWQVDNSGNLLSKTTYGLVFTPDTDETTILSTAATAINDNGVAVGVSDAPYRTIFIDTAVIFENGETIRIIEDEDLMPNAATGINNNGYVVGYQTYLIGNSQRTKAFVYDRNSSDISFLEGLFVGSSAIPRAINNNNLVVGEADVEGGLSSRQKGGFLYDINSDTFSNLNNLIACDTDYNIVSADDINDSDEISASALVKRPSRDLRGNVLLNTDGEEVLIDTVIAVKLVPTGQGPSDCGSSEDDIVVERQGASNGIITVAGLTLIALFRRRYLTQ